MVLTKLSSLSDIIAITETKLTLNQIPINIKLDVYVFLHSDSTSKAGGMGLYIKESIHCTIKQNININLPFVENMWLEVQIMSGPITEGVVY